MKTKLFFLSLLLTASAHAEMYKWVDANGKVTYSDQPAPASARQSAKKPLAPTQNDEASLPYSLATVSRDHPVILYTSNQCAPCDQGRTFLKSRGIPFSEKSVATSNDMNVLKQAGGDGRLPHVSVGRAQLTGFEAASWNSALTAAGYPQSSRLPGNYRFPQAQPAAPTVPPAAGSDDATQAPAAP